MATALYETDFYGWSLHQAALLRNEEYAELDIENLVEEIEAMARRDRRELGRRLMRILEHLLKLLYEPGSRASGKWRRSVLTQRLELQHFFETNYALRAQIDDFVEVAYLDARQLAASGLGCLVDDLPKQCPWSVEQILDVKWLP
jgi:hypothetical protein